jgi:hypothetical protein
LGADRSGGPEDGDGSGYGAHQRSTR